MLGLHSHRDKMRTIVWGVHSSHLPHSWPVLVTSRTSQRHVGKSVPNQRKQECLECLVSLSMILARECEYLHSCILRLIHISPKVSTSTWDENVNQALKFPENLSEISENSRKIFFKSPLQKKFKIRKIFLREIILYFCPLPGDNSFTECKEVNKKRQ